MSVVDKIQLQRNGPFYDIRDNTKAPLDHTHDDRYYTESEVDSKELDIYNAINGKLPLSGGTITGDLAVNSSIAFPGVRRANVPGSSDLNNYYLSGHYACNQSSVAATVGNVPVARAFILDVYSGVGDVLRELKTWMYITQRFETYTGDAYIRHGETGASTTITWGAWKKVVKASDFAFGEGAVSVSPSPTTLAKIGTITMPSGQKILTVRLAYGNSEPLELALGNDSWINLGQTSRINTQTSQLCLTVFTTETSVVVYGKWSGGSPNNYNYKYTVIPG